MDQEGGAAVVPAGRQPADSRRISPVLRQGPDQVRSLRPRAFQARGIPSRASRRGAPWSVHRKNVVLMPSYVNVGAYVDEGTMVDTWATVGSCAQIGRNVHLSGGVGIGGGPQPLQAKPPIVEDKFFVGARSENVEERKRGVEGKRVELGGGRI